MSESRELDKKISDLVKYALANGLNEKKIVKLALESHIKYNENKKKTKSILLRNWKSFSFLVAVLAICLIWSSFSKFLYFILRFALIQLLAVFDWTTFYQRGCILENPFIHDTSEDRIDCTTCKDLQILVNGNNFSAKDILRNNIYKNIPIIINDAVKDDWKALKLFNKSFIFELFKTNDILKTALPCVMYTNKKRSNEQELDSMNDFITLLTTQENNPNEEWFSFWENCNKTAVRILRKYYKRPYFIHSSVEISFTNWIMISTSHNLDYFINTDMNTAVTWFVQFKGMTRIRLHPSSCNHTCKDIYATVREGETVLWTQPYWQFSYHPMVLTEDNISMMFGGFLD